MTDAAIHVEDDGAVRHLVLCRPGELNTITPGLREELDFALDAADVDRSVKVVLPASRRQGVLCRVRARLVDGLAGRR